MLSKYFCLESERLYLLPLSYEFLTLLDSQPDVLAQKLGLTKCAIDMEEPFDSAYKEAMHDFWLPQTMVNATNYKWLTNWLVIDKASKKCVGGIGFAGIPEEAGESEVGYGMDINERGKGYATEALQCLINWGFTQPKLKTVIAHTLPDGEDSQKVLKKCGFECHGQITNQDGEVLLWKLEKAIFHF